MIYSPDTSILLHRPTPWQSEVTCSTKIFARYFRDDGFRVAYMENPFDLGHIVKWKGYYHIWKKAPRKEEGIWIINPFVPIPIRDRFPFNTQCSMNAGYRFSIPSISNLLQRGGMQSPDIVWSARPGGAIFKSLFPQATLIMQVVDYYPAFRGDYIKEIERRDYETADHVFLIGHAMLDYITGELGINAGKVTVLGQGVSLHNYKKKTFCPEEIKHIPGPIAVWVGVLDKGDAPMFEQAAGYLKQIGGSLLLIGPSADWAVELQRRYHNVYLLGARKPADIPAYLLHSDIGLMLYDRSKNEVYYGQNPLKLYEYAAAGLVILSTPHREFDFLNSPVIELRSPEDVSMGIQRALAEKDDWNKASLEFSQAHDWANVYATAREKIYDVVNRELQG